MQDWNVVVSVREHHYTRERALLAAHGRVDRTPYYNVLALAVDDPAAFAEALRSRLLEEPELAVGLGRVMPVTTTFVFQSPQEFEAKAREAVTPWIEALGGKSFHVRLHRRGFKERLSSQEEERFLDHFLLERLQAQDSPGHISFEDPDAIIAVETIGQWAGLALWTRAQLERYPFLRVD